MNAEFFSAIEDIEKEKGIPRQYMYEKIHQAMLAAFRKDNPEAADNVVIEMSEEKRKIDMYILKDVVEEVENPATQLTEEAAKAINKRAKVGGQVKVPVETKKFGRIAAQSAKQVIIQGIREAERGIVYEEFTSKEHEILTGVVQRIDPRTGGVSIRISSNSEFTEALLPANEQIRGETLTEGDRIKVYVVEVRNSTRGPQVLISRTHPGLVKRLFELEVPEIFDGLITIKKVVRVPGERAKVAVESYDERIDPIGACIGVKGSRIIGIVRELRNENIDVLQWTSNTQLLIQRALNPARVSSIDLGNSPEDKIKVYMQPDEVKKGIGRGGCNIKLAGMLVGREIEVWRELSKEEIQEEEDVLLDDFSNEIDQWVIDRLKAIGCDTAKSVLAFSPEDIAKRADLEDETVADVFNILKAEFED